MRPTLRSFAGIATLFACAAACSASTPATPPAVAKQQATPPAVAAPRAHSVEIRNIAPNIWVHTSYGVVPGLGPFPSNGLVVQGAQGAVIVDTAWGLASTAELLDWASHEAGSVVAVLVTHWHDDRTSGLPEVHRRGIKSYASSKTLEESRQHGVPQATHALEELASLGELGIEAETFYPGRGHTNDNIVVWLPRSQVLFGGCLVKAASATSLGNVADATVGEWSTSVGALQQRYPLPHVVVPGHGASGGPELLQHTRALAEAAAATQAGGK